MYVILFVNILRARKCDFKEHLMSKFKSLTPILVVAIFLLAAVFVAFLGGAVPMQTASAEFLDISRSSYPTVEVNDDVSFREALEGDGNKFIVVTKDITVESETNRHLDKAHPSYYYDYFTQIESIHVKGNKILDLNGHEIYYSDKSQLYYYMSTGGFGNELKSLRYHGEYSVEGTYAFSYENTLIYVDDGASLRITDSQGDKGTLQFDSMFSEIDDAPFNVIRNVVQVEKGGELYVHGGNIVAGRNKKIYSYVRVSDVNSTKNYYKTVTAYNMGSAVIANGGNVIVTGGVLKGRGATYDGHEVACVLVKDGSLLVEGGKLFGYGYAHALRVHEKALANVRITNGYFEAYKEEYAAYTGSLGLYSNLHSAKLGALVTDDNEDRPLDYSQIIDQDATSFYVQTGGDKDGDPSEFNKQYCTFSP